MLDLYEELAKLIGELERRHIEYAVCGGLAMAIWGLPRATVDIDLLVEESSADRVAGIAASLGYVHKAKPMRFAGGKIRIRRVSKIDPDAGDVLMIDLLLVTDAIQEVWQHRQRVAWEHGELSVVSKEGLITLKSFRSTGTDKDDIERLRSSE